MRLACLSHAASVQAEPGSNSSIKFLGTAQSSCRVWLLSQLARTDSFMAAFILEMSLSIPNKLRQLEWLLLPHRRQGAGSVEPSHRTGSMLQGSNIFFWLPRVRDTRGLLKLIKEDHFACTTRMFEILACPSACPSIHRLRDFLGLASRRDLVA